MKNNLTPILLKYLFLSTFHSKMKFAVMTCCSSKTPNMDFLNIVLMLLFFNHIMIEKSLPENFLIKIGNKSEIGEKLVICKAWLKYANSKTVKES